MKDFRKILDPWGRITINSDPPIIVRVLLSWVGDHEHAIDINRHGRPYPATKRVDELGLDFIEEYRGEFTYTKLTDELVIKTIAHLQIKFEGKSCLIETIPDDAGDGE